MALDTWLIYLLAVAGLTLTPGPNSLLALTHGALYGHRRTCLTIAGSCTGFMLIVALSLLGIGALLQTSGSILLIMKWLGAAYLIYLGIQVWRSPVMSMNQPAEPKRRSNLALFRAGFTTSVSNPKVILFFAAFFPQFIDPERSLLTQFVVMALTIGMIEVIIEFTLARAAFQLRPVLERSGKIFNRCCGGMFAGIGLALPFSN
ncbi:LysE family translocator [Aliamphritea spongicola]|uniref:LysE family translocator n=1 Tax=Aliamphritea spongicola TaxID=707589 RepID=UPI00196B983F|nr:LysE family translocator [Aliamphritea spongicola]MBN3560995.1 LysE family translocator [Aliamphritea spongicola]